MNRAHDPRRLRAAALTLALLALPAAAEDVPPPDGDAEGVFLESVDVNVVNVEVYVTDREGNRLTGLGKDDFELFVDGRPHAISYFYAVDENGPAPVDGAPPAAPPPPVDPRLAEEQAAAVPDEQRLHLVVYVDNLNLRPFNRNRVLGAARTFLRTSLRPGDEVMLVTFERSLHVREPFTSRHERVASALYDLEELSGHAVHYDSDRRDILQAVFEAESVTEVRGRVSQYAGSLFNDLSFTYDALKEVVEQLAGLPGRKAVLYVSDGVAMRPGEDVFHALHQRFSDTSVLSDSFQYDMTRRVQELTASANANRVTFYTIDAAGLRTYTYMEASNQQAYGGAFVDQVHFSNLQSPLLFMADATGGVAVVNTNDFTDGFARFAGDLGHYYSLGFSPSGIAGRYHDVEVKVKGQGKALRVRHREGFRDKPIETRMADTTLAALHYGYVRNEMGVELEVGSGTPQRDSKHFLVPITVRVPIDRLSLLPHEDVQRGRLRLFIVAMDAEGGLSPVQDVPVPIEIPTAALADAAGKLYPYQVQLLMRSGRQVVAVGVRDEIGADTAFVARRVQIGG